MGQRSSARSPSPVTVLVFDLTDPSLPFVGIPREEDCRFDLVEMLPRGDGEYAEFFAVTGADPEGVADRLSDDDEVDANPLEREGEEGLVELVVSDHCPAVELAGLGAFPRTVRGTADGGRIHADLPDWEDPRAVTEAFLDAYPSADLAAKRRKDQFLPLFEGERVGKLIGDRLTDRQVEVIRTAYRAGYYEWPREATGREVADALGISSATFSQHVKAAERKILRAMFRSATEDGDPQGSPNAGGSTPPGE